MRARARQAVVPVAMALWLGAIIPAAAGGTVSPAPSPSGTPTATPTPSAPSTSTATPSPSGTTGPVPTSSPNPAPVAPGSGIRAQPKWVRRIDDLVAGKQMSVAIGSANDFLYRHRAGIRRIPASNEKLALSMALLDAFGPDSTIGTDASAGTLPDAGGVVDGNLWIRGHGDPEVGRASMAALARQIVASGITRIRGRVLGSTRYFARDWWAPGWRRSFPADDVAFPTALTFEDNVGPSGGHIHDPELRAARSLTKQLESRGVRVAGRPGDGRAPNGLVDLATVDSAPLHKLVREMDVDSLNFYAEVLGKGLGAEASGAPGTIAKGAAAITSFVRASGVRRTTAYDSSGLSYRDRLTTAGIVRLLWVADSSTWLKDLRMSLPRPGQGTLKDRLTGLKVRAKTGTLTGVSALSGWVWLDGPGAWAEFSILSKGLSKTTAIRIEDAIVKTVEHHAP